MTRQGTLPRLTNRSLNCQNPQDEATLLPFLPAQRSPAWALPSGRRQNAAQRPLPSAGSPRIGLDQIGPRRKGSPSSGTGTPPRIALQARKEARLPRNVHAGCLVFFFFFNVKMCISAHLSSSSGNTDVRQDHLPRFWKMPEL